MAITVNMREFTIIKNSITRVINNTLSDVGNLIILNTKNNFARRGNKDGRWKPLVTRSRSTGNISRSLRKVITGTTVTISSNLRHSNIQNYGGRIRVTERSKKFFWAKFYETKEVFWKNLALTKKTHIFIPARRYLEINSDILRTSVVLFERHLTKLVKGR